MEEKLKSNPNQSQRRYIVYWITIIILGFMLITGGIGEMLHLWGTVEGTVNRLGYPIYFLTILGIWKILGGFAILVPRLPLFKEWAYAGIFFNLTGAAISSTASGESAHHIIVPVIFTVIAIASWALRPPSCKLI